MRGSATGHRGRGARFNPDHFRRGDTFPIAGDRGGTLGGHAIQNGSVTGGSTLSPAPGSGSEPYDIYANSQIRESARADMVMLLRNAGGSPLSGVPDTVNQYYGILPLENNAGPVIPAGGGGHGAGSAGASSALVYKAVSSETGSAVALRRILGAPPAHSAQIVRAAEAWKRFSHPGVVSLREVFTTRAFSAATAASATAASSPSGSSLGLHAGSAAHAANEVVFAYDLHPRAETMHNLFLNASHPQHPLGEPMLWAVTTQLLSAMSAVHAVGLSLRSALHPSSILLTGRNRVRINRVALSDAFDIDGAEHLPGGTGSGNSPLSPAGTGPPSLSMDSSRSPLVARTVSLQREDLAALGRILLVLATRSHAAQVRAGVLVSGVRAAMDVLQRSGVYSADFVQVVAVLLAAASPTSRTVVRDVLAMVGPRMATEMSNVWIHADSLEAQVMKECDAGRLFRLTTLLGFVNERVDATTGDQHWSETGDRYLLKLFRDYVFHRVDEKGRPVTDMAHVVECLNRLDVGSQEQVLLGSRDGVSLIAASYEDLRRCLLSAVEDLRQRGGSVGNG